MIYGSLICYSGHVRFRRASRCGAGSTSLPEFDAWVITLSLAGRWIGVRVTMNDPTFLVERTMSSGG
jgi:hypothetical protein